MSGTGDAINEGADQGKSAVNRRRLLKGAAAAGVGAVAWSSPNIRTLGATPAYATHTATTAIITLLSDCDSLQANCSSDPNSCAGTPAWGPASNPGIVGVDVGGVRNAALVSVTGCVTTGSSSAVVSTQPPGFFCEVVQIRISNGGNAAQKFVFNTPSSPGAGNGINDPLVFPAVDVGTGNCPYFICAILSCTAT